MLNQLIDSSHCTIEPCLSLLLSSPTAVVWYKYLDPGFSSPLLLISSTAAAAWRGMGLLIVGTHITAKLILIEVQINVSERGNGKECKLFTDCY